MRRLLVPLLLAAGCAGGTAPPRAPTASTSASPVDRALEHTLVERCSVCHDGQEPRRPTFDDKRTLTRGEAMRVALAVASQLMPPPPAALDDETRRRVIALGCARAADGNEAVAACVARLARPTPELWLVGLDGMLGIADRAATAAEPGVHFDEKAGAALAKTFQLVETTARSIRLDGTLATLLALHAAERCGDPAKVGEAPYRACVRAITDYRAMVLPGRSVAKPPMEVRP